MLVGATGADRLAARIPFACFGQTYGHLVCPLGPLAAFPATPRIAQLPLQRNESILLCLHPRKQSGLFQVPSYHAQILCSQKHETQQVQRLVRPGMFSLQAVASNFQIGVRLYGATFLKALGVKKHRHLGPIAPATRQQADPCRLCDEPLLASSQRKMIEGRNSSVILDGALGVSGLDKLRRKVLGAVLGLLTVP